MTQPPRRRPPTEEERWKVIARRAAGGSDAGGTQFYRRVPDVSAGGAIPGSGGRYAPLGWGPFLEDPVPEESLPVGDYSRCENPDGTPGVAGTAVGWGATGAESAVAVGHNANAIKIGSIAIGAEAGVYINAGHGEYAVALGYAALARGNNSVAIGPNSVAENEGDIALGTAGNTVAVYTPLHTTAGGAAGKYLPIRAEDGVVYLLPLYNLP